MAQTDARKRAAATSGQALAGDRHLPRIGGIKAAQYVKKRRFAAARPPEDRDDLVTLDRKAYAIDQAPSPAPAADRLDEVMSPEDGHTTSGPDLEEQSLNSDWAGHVS